MVDADTILNKHQRTTKNKFMWTTSDKKVFGTNDESEVEVIRQAVLKHEASLLKKK